MKRYGIKLGKCSYCGAENKNVIYCYEDGLEHDWICGACQIGKCKVLEIVEEFEVK